MVVVNISDVRDDARYMAQATGQSEDEWQNKLIAARIEKAEWELFESERYMAAIRRKIPLYRAVNGIANGISWVAGRVDALAFSLGIYPYFGVRGKPLPLRVKYLRYPMKDFAAGIRRFSAKARRIGLRIAGIDEIEEVVIRVEIGEKV